MSGMIASQLAGSASQRFLVRYWVPAFVALLVGLGLAAAAGAGPAMVDGVLSLGDLGKTLLVICLVLVVTVSACLLMGVNGLILGVAQGEGWPQPLIVRAIRSQEAKRDRSVATARTHLAGGTRDYLARRAVDDLANRFPDGPDVAPTVLANTLLASGSYARQVYGMPAEIWWARLLSVVPDDYRSALNDALDPVLALLNLTMVMLIAAVGGVVLILTGAPPVTCLAIVVAALIAARGLYLAACGQSVEYGQLIRVGFDLHRGDLIEALGATVPDNLDDERKLWADLTARVEPNLTPLLAAPAPAAGR